VLQKVGVVGLEVRGHAGLLGVVRWLFVVEGWSEWVF
jgi:hypothetical protein